MELRRQTFDWETDILDEFLYILKDFYLDENTSDKIVWRYLINSLANLSKKELLAQVSTVLWKTIWVVKVPTKIKIFILLLLRRRLPVRGHLVRLNLSSALINTCLFCGDMEKLINPRFIYCKRIGPTWYKVDSLWDISIVCSCTILEFFKY